MKRWIVYLLVFLGIHVYLISSLREFNKNYLNFGIKEGISQEKWSFDFMNRAELYEDSIRQISLDDFLGLKKNVHLTRGFGKAVAGSSKINYKKRYLHYLTIITSLFAFFMIWLFGFFNRYFSVFTRLSEPILLVGFTSLVTFLAWKDNPGLLEQSLGVFFLFGKGLIYAFTLFYFFQFLDKKKNDRLNFADQEAIKFILLLLFGSIISFLGGYLQFLIVNIFEINLFGVKNYDWKFYITPFILPFWLAIATGNFLNNFRKHFFQLRRKAKAFKYAREQELEFKSELETLQAKINPHFLYNSLNSIASLAQSDPEKTETMALALSKFYKEKTNRKENLWSTVAEEIDMIKTYLAIEKIRFGDRLQIELYSDGNANEEKIPRFLLQPLIENAIKYGYNSADNKIRVKVFIERSNRVLSIRILDSGPKFSDQLNTGYGIRSVQKKLKLFYPNNHKMEFINTPEKQIFIQIKT